MTAPVVKSPRPPMRWAGMLALFLGPFARRAKFSAERWCLTANMSDAVASSGAMADAVLQAVRRHFLGDWGECCEEDRKANDEALKHGTRVLGSYEAPGGRRIWIITEGQTADRFPGRYYISTCLFPEDY